MFAFFDKILLFIGSYNWTENAERFNYENAIFIFAPEVISKYQKEFNAIANNRKDGQGKNKFYFGPVVYF